MFPLSDRELGRQATEQDRAAGRAQATVTMHDHDAELVEAALPAILGKLLDSMLHTVSICGRCWSDHFQAKPELPHRDCLNVRCQCWCTTRRDQ